MTTPVARREALRSLALLPLGAVVLGTAACSKTPQCDDVSGLSPADVTTRKEAAAYEEKASDPSKTCDKCMQFVAAAPDQCGSCKVVKGPINPKGGCKLFVAKA